MNRPATTDDMLQVLDDLRNMARERDQFELCALFRDAQAKLAMRVLKKTHEPGVPASRDTESTPLDVGGTIQDPLPRGAEGGQAEARPPGSPIRPPCTHCHGDPGALTNFCWWCGAVLVAKQGDGAGDATAVAQPPEIPAGHPDQGHQAPAPSSIRELARYEDLRGVRERNKQAVHWTVDADLADATVDALKAALKLSEDRARQEHARYQSALAGMRTKLDETRARIAGLEAAINELPKPPNPNEDNPYARIGAAISLIETLTKQRDAAIASITGAVATLRGDPV